MNESVVFSQDEVLEIREQYVSRIAKLERQNEELELMLRRALNQVRAVEEVMRRAAVETRGFEAALVKLVDECDILADEEAPRPRITTVPSATRTASGTLPKVIVSDVPPVSTIGAGASPVPAMRTPPRSIFTAHATAGTVTVPPPPAVPAIPASVPTRLQVVSLSASESESAVSDDMVVEENALTVVAAKIPMPLPPVSSAPMPGAPTAASSSARSALRALVARAQKSAPSRVRLPA